jgi:hypothetical protein
MYRKDVENEIYKLIERYDCPTVVNAIREVMLHEIHDESKTGVKGNPILKRFVLDNRKEHRLLFDHARFYPGFVVLHPYSLTKNDLETLTQACNDAELGIRIDGSSDRVFGSGVRIIVFVPGSVTPENLDKASPFGLTPSMIRQIIS